MLRKIYLEIKEGKKTRLIPFASDQKKFKRVFCHRCKYRLECLTEGQKVSIGFTSPSVSSVSGFNSPSYSYITCSGSAIYSNGGYMLPAGFDEGFICPKFKSINPFKVFWKRR